MHTNEQILEANKTQAIRMIKENLAQSDKWVIRALLVIYAHQTAVEQSTNETRENNGIGFNSADSMILSSFAQQVMDFEAGLSRFNAPLSNKQMGIVRNKISKYASQLLKVAKNKAESARRQAEVEATIAYNDKMAGLS